MKKGFIKNENKGKQFARKVAAQTKKPYKPKSGPFKVK
jgi:hypothetical protein